MDTVLPPQETLKTNSNKEIKRRGRPRKKLETSIEVAPISHTPHEDDDVQLLDECLVCTDRCQQALPCGHSIHLNCIAMSGQTTCSLCRKDVEHLFNDQQRECYIKRKTEIEKERKEAEQRESLRLAHQLQRENQHPQHQEIAMLRYNGRTHRVTLNPIMEGMTSDELMLELNQIMVNVNNRVLEFTTDQRALELYKVLVDLNRISAMTGLTVSDCCNIIQNVV